jgi:hypothetical protein
VAASEATGSGFEARAGTLTLFFMTSAESREYLLELLERARYGGLLGPPEAYEGWPEEDEDEFDEEARWDLADPDSAIGPHTLMRATSKGEELLFVACVLERWLRNCPDGPLQVGPSGGEAIASLVCCWSATVTHALAWQPLTLVELDRAVEILDYDTIEEHVEAMRRTGHVDVLSGEGEPRYAVTDWLREGLAPLAAAARLERHYPEEDIAPPDILDVEAAFQLTLPLLRLPADLAGPCRLGAQMPGGSALLAGATAQIEKGRVVSASPLLDEDPQTWATGSPIDWLDALVEPSAARLETGGDTRLARALVQGLNQALFAPIPK